MKKTGYGLMAMSFLAVSLTAFAQSGDSMKQDTMKRDNQMKHDTMKADNMSKAAVNVSGRVSEDGKILVSDKDNKAWTVSNPAALKGHEGHHVTVRAHIDAARNEIHVTSVTMAKGEMKGSMSKHQMD